MNPSDLCNKFPLHHAIWRDDYDEVVKILKNKENKYLLEQRDPRGRTPLTLAVCLGLKKIVKILLHSNANANAEDKYGYNVLHEAISIKDSELVLLILETRDKQRTLKRKQGIEKMLNNNTPDFYVELHWEFVTWVPFLSQLCPSDTYKIYKNGSSFRIDVSLVQGENDELFKRSNLSYIFKIGGNNRATSMKIDHDKKKVKMNVDMPLFEPDDYDFKPSLETIESRLTSPIKFVALDTDGITFERKKSFLGFGYDVEETINGYVCKVYDVKNMQSVSRTRFEHINNYKDKSQIYVPIFGFKTYEENGSDVPYNASPTPHIINPLNISDVQYFNPDFDLEGRDIGNPRKTIVNTCKFKASLWVCDDYPISLQEQILPIIDIMALTSSRFAKLRDFIKLKLPSGFPIKIEIPLFHILSANITFNNIFGLTNLVDGVEPNVWNSLRSCVIDEKVFGIPKGYDLEVSHQSSYGNMNIESELYPCFANLQDSSIDNESLTVWEALKSFDSDLQRALQESREEYQVRESQQIPNSNETISQTSDKNGHHNTNANSHFPPVNICDGDKNDWNPATLEFAMRLSEAEKEKEDRNRIKEEEILQKVLELSLKEK